ncbi:hypothetical protein BH18ACT15_BH18ACT15_14500 [soil metagenome]
MRRGSLTELAEEARARPVRGEVVVVVAGAAGVGGADLPPEELARRARRLMASGVSRKEALDRVAKECGVRKRRVFDALVAPGAGERKSG